MKNSRGGFTLIEVLVALAILSIALTAMIKATAQNIRDTSYIQTKMAAHYVALDVINNARAGLINLPRSGDVVENDTSMLDQDWHWQLGLVNTGNKSIKEIHVTVTDNNEHRLASLTSYIYAPQKNKI